MKVQRVKPHKESLLNIPLIQQMLEDPSVSWVERAVDREWYYQQAIPFSMNGFNPLLNTVFYSKNSRLSEWLKKPHASVRANNLSDVLVKEVFFAAHDYLHCWAYLAIQELMPRLGFATARITARNIEDFVFCHLLTEAVATVGVDYWLLCAQDLNQVVPIGTRVRSLTVNYQEACIEEYRRFDPGLRVQQEEFFGSVVQFYLDGFFKGFNLSDLKRSPILEVWLEKELVYGEVQRAYARQWLSYLSSDDIQYSSEQLNRGIALDAPWKVKLVAELGHLLWNKVKLGQPHYFKPSVDPKYTWKISSEKPLDFRFVNLNRLREKPSQLRELLYSGAHSTENFTYYLYQFVSKYPNAQVDPHLSKLFPSLISLRDPELLAALFKPYSLLKVNSTEPRELFLLN